MPIEAREGEAKGRRRTRSHSLPPSLVLSLSLRFQRESRVYEECVPSHSVFGAGFVGIPHHLKVTQLMRYATWIVDPTDLFPLQNRRGWSYSLKAKVPLSDSTWSLPSPRSGRESGWE